MRNHISTHQATISRITRDQRGVVSLTVTMVLMMVISLLVIGFAQVSRRNQRQALDQQLSTQAFYAAESGVNAARNAMKGQVASAIPVKSSCTSGTGIFDTASLGSSTIGNPANDVSYSCLLVNPLPLSLKYGDGVIDTNDSTVIPLNNNVGAFDTFKFVWTSSQSNADANCPNKAAVGGETAFTDSTNWKCGYGVLRFDLVPVSKSASTMDVNSLSDSTMTTFAVPTADGDTGTTFASNGSNDVVPVKCDDVDCELTVSIPPSAPQSQSFYLRVKSVYAPMKSFEISGTVGGKSVGLTDAQALIDATGKAQDVLRRIQVRVPISGATKNKASDYAIQTRDSICKRFSIMSNYFSSDVDDSFASNANGGNPLCKRVTIATPTAPPSAGAIIGSCTVGCDVGGGGPTGGGAHPKSWSRHFRNLSVNTAKVVGCVWTFGDGSRTVNEACNYGEVVSHHYEEIDRCIPYTVTLTVTLDNGAVGYKEYSTYVPHGEGTSEC